MNATLLCNGRFRSLTAIDTTPPPWTHIAPRGEFPGMVEIPAGYDVPGYGRAVDDISVEGVTVFNDETLESMVQSFRADILIDADHLSHDQNQSTEAMGWGHELRYMPDRDGLELKTTWTPPGREKITTLVYRYISPELSGSARYEEGTFKFYPSALVGAGLTNRPKLKALRPVSENHDTAKSRNAPDKVGREMKIHNLLAKVRNRHRCNFETALTIAEGENPSLFFQDLNGEKLKEIQRKALVAEVKNREGCSFQMAWNIAKTKNPKLFCSE